MADICGPFTLDQLDQFGKVDAIQITFDSPIWQSTDTCITLNAGSASAFPDGLYTIEDMIAEQDKVMIRGSFKGTHRGEFMGIPGTGKEITMSWITVLHLNEGKVVERWMKFDEILMMSQVGFQLVPPG